MSNFLLQKTKQFLLKKLNVTPQIAIITGSGIKLFEDHKVLFKMNYGKLFAQSPSRRSAISSVKGHEGILKVYKIKNKHVLVFSGRHHLYEGLKITEVVKNIRLSYELGIKKILITNAAGGINNKLRVGDLMLINGFINLMQATEHGVLDGITQSPKKIKSKLTQYIEKKFKKEIKTGIYAGVLGPSYETYSEIDLLQKLGASAVGMSSIPEFICANSLGLDYAGVSVISNIWDKKHKPSHKEVLQNVSKANKKLNDLILDLVAKCHPEERQ